MATFDWFTKYGVSCDWACHRVRGSLGGEDRAHPVGQPVLAPYDGVVTYGYYNDGASYVQIKYDNGYAHQAIHVQKGSRLPNGTRVAEGTRVAISGGAKGMDGAGTSTGAHVHFQGHDRSGRRIPWQDVPAPYQRNGVAASVGRPVTTQAPQIRKAEDMAREYYRHGDTGQIAVVTGGEMITLGEADARKLLDIDRINRERNPYVYPAVPNFDDPHSFFNVDQAGWDLLAAVYKYRL